MFRMKLVFAVTVFVFASLAHDGNALVTKEFRTLLPYSVDEYLLGYRWSIAQSSILETGGGEGVQVFGEPEPFDNDEFGVGEYTHKVLHLREKAPPLFDSMAGGMVKVHEESWFTSTGVTTIYSERKIMGDDFSMKIRTEFVDDDNCQRDDVFPESGSAEVVKIDFTSDIPDEEAEWDPTQCSSDKLNRGPLTSGWTSDQPRMCVYSYVEITFDWAILQNIVEGRTMGAYQSLVEKIYRQMFCWADDWAGLTEKDVDRKERETKIELNQIRKTGEVRGHFEGVSPS